MTLGTDRHARGDAKPISRRIVVGVDGSSASLAALRWAVDEARSRQAEVIAVRAWNPLMEGRAWYAPARDVATLQLQGRQVAAELDRALRDVLDQADREATGERVVPEVKVERQVVRGRPGSALLTACEDADLLVLGGHRSLVPGYHTLGAVATTCVRRAPCPIVLVTPSGKATTLSGSR